MTYYHGTKCEFAAGQELTPRPGFGHVWAASHPATAAMHARYRGGRTDVQGHVYVVEPMGAVELDPLDHGNRSSWRSPAGFRVVRELGSPESLLGLA